MAVKACNQSMTQRAAYALLTLPLPANAQHPLAMQPPTQLPRQVAKAAMGPDIVEPIGLDNRKSCDHKGTGPN